MFIDSREHLCHSTSQSQPNLYFFTFQQTYASFLLLIFFFCPKEQGFTFICVELFSSVHHFDSIFSSSLFSTLLCLMLPKIQLALLLYVETTVLQQNGKTNKTDLPIFRLFKTTTRLYQSSFNLVIQPVRDHLIKRSVGHKQPSHPKADDPGTLSATFPVFLPWLQVHFCQSLFSLIV